ncbi:MAG TPA: GGDEF domain-containing protein [Jatrophihabitantaceae bacterium]
MVGPSAVRGDDSDSVRQGVRSWALWSLPRNALAFVLTLDLLAGGLTALALVRAHPTKTDAARFALLAVLGVVVAGVVSRTERSHRAMARGPTVDPTSVWTFAAVLLLPAGYAALLVVLLYAHTMLRTRRDRSWYPHRVTFTGATIVLSVLTAAAINRWVSEMPHLPEGAARALGVLAALAAFRFVNDGAIAVVLWLATKPAAFTDVLVGRDEFAVEVATMILGAFTAQTIIQLPWLTPAVLVLIVMMYRGLLARKLEVDATTDGKTGLLNASAWRELAQRHLWRAIREDQAAAMLVVDLDRFKALNDEYGHLAADMALTAVADCIKHELRDYDAVGRYGGEEFVAMLPNAGTNAGMRAAERVRARIEQCTITAEPDGPEMHLTASIGVATYPSYGTELDEVIRAADLALYAAKAAGRNTVRLAESRVTPASQQPRPSHA